MLDCQSGAIYLTTTVVAHYRLTVGVVSPIVVMMVVLITTSTVMTKTTTVAAIVKETK